MTQVCYNFLQLVRYYNFYNPKTFMFPTARKDSMSHCLVVPKFSDSKNKPYTTPKTFFLIAKTLVSTTRKENIWNYLVVAKYTDSEVQKFSTKSFYAFYLLKSVKEDWFVVYN